MHHDFRGLCLYPIIANEMIGTCRFRMRLVRSFFNFDIPLRAWMSPLRCAHPLRVSLPALLRFASHDSIESVHIRDHLRRAQAAGRVPRLLLLHVH